MYRLLLLITAICIAVPAHAKDLRGRSGVGFNQQFGHVSALSVRYGLPTPSPVINVQVEGAFGLDTAAGKDGGNVFAGARVLYGFLAEDNMNLFAGGGLGIVTEQSKSTNSLQTFKRATSAMI